MMEDDEMHAKHAQSGSPFVTVKYAQTLDGRIATAAGNSQWISSRESLQFAHELRRDHDAIMVGIRTVLADNPRLTVRLVEGRDPLRVIIDSHLRIPLGAKVIAEGAAHNTLIAATASADRERARELEALGAKVLLLGSDPGTPRVDLPGLLAELGRLGIRSILVEGGARVITSLLSARLVDRLVVAVAPKIIGRGTEAIGELNINDLGNAITFTNFETHRLGPDLIFDGRLNSTTWSDE
jgi:riboflavin-specific deaminase-like protein